MIHFSGIRNLEPGVLVFPKVLVCFDCGVSHFTLQADEGLLKENIAA
jgi:hypothetical protein